VDYKNKTRYHPNPNGLRWKKILFGKDKLTRRAERVASGFLCFDGGAGETGLGFSTGKGARRVEKQSQDALKESDMTTFKSLTPTNVL